MRGTFANVRLRNQLAPGTEGGVTVWDGEQTTIYEAAMTAAEQGVPLCVLAGEEYGSGSSRDWAAKGPNLLGIRFVLAQSYERIHRSNLVGMGVLPLQFPDGESVASLGLTGEETFDLAPLEDGATTLRVSTSTGVEFDARVRIDTPNEWRYFRHGGILHFVLRQLQRAADDRPCATSGRWRSTTSRSRSTASTPRWSGGRGCSTSRCAASGRGWRGSISATRSSRSRRRASGQLDAHRLSRTASMLFAMVVTPIDACVLRRDPVERQ